MLIINDITIERFLNFAIEAFPNLDKTVISNIKAKRRPIPSDVIVGTCNYISHTRISYLLPDFYYFALDFNFRYFKANHLAECFKKIDELREEEE